jgi:hypothetical protein
MKTCPKCNVLHEKKGIFCSRTCANSWIFSEEAKLKKSLALKGKSFKRSENFDLEKWKSKVIETRLKKYKTATFEELGLTNKRRRIFEEQNHCCNNCGISEWLGQKINLELEHKDGNTENNSRDNLEGLCPNCHSLTETWRGRNKPARNGLCVIDDNLLLEHLQNSKNIRQGLLSAGLAAKGKNYERSKKLLKSNTCDN